MFLFQKKKIGADECCTYLCDKAATEKQKKQLEALQKKMQAVKSVAVTAQEIE
ncbi:MAG: hypothetical protein UHS54_00630 [Lachnospiraceae bacterium]|nr:hypothetical protein [Lachnospiraceae bacterium]